MGIKMNHSEALEQMAVERYLLNELPADLRDSFEEHAFDCPECALDLRAAAAFVDHSKTELPSLVSSVQGASGIASQPSPKKPRWQLWLRPVFAVPAFAALLLVIAYQNLSTIPALESMANQAHILPATSLYAGTRGGGSTSVLADRKQGAVLSVELPAEPAYATFIFELYDPQSRLVLSRTVAASITNGGNGAVSLVVPAVVLRQGSYTLSISGLTAQGQRILIDRHICDFRFIDNN